MKLLRLLYGTIRGVVGGLLGIIVAAQLGSLILPPLGLPILPWEMAGVVVPFLCAIGSVFVGAVSAAIGNRWLGAIVGVLILGGLMTLIMSGNGSPPGTAVWAVLVAVTAGATAGAAAPVPKSHSERPKEPASTATDGYVL